MSAKRKPQQWRVWAAVKNGRILAAGFKRSALEKDARSAWEGYAIHVGKLTLGPAIKHYGGKR